MSRKTYTTAVVIIPPPEVWSPIQAIRQIHDRHVKRWMPHITLLYPFRPREEFPALATLFAPVCADLVPFPVTLGAFQFFRHQRQSYTLWLAPEPKEALVRLHTALWAIVPNCDEVRRHQHGFTPHLSVGQVQGYGPLIQLYHTLQAHWLPLTFTVREVSLIWRGEPPDDVFRVAQTVQLGKGVRGEESTPHYPEKH
jgi:2'-5' RNA ligase